MVRENVELESFLNVPKRRWIKWLIFLCCVYALYNAVYVFAESQRLLLEEEDLTVRILPLVARHIDLPLVVGGVLICLLFDKRRLVDNLAIHSMKQIAGLVISAVIFVAAVYITQPSGMVDVYQILHVLVATSFVSELCYRGFLFSWMRESGLGISAYLISGICWGAQYAIRSLILGNQFVFWAVLPMALFGLVAGTALAAIYERSESLWLVVYLHAAVALL